MCVMWWRMENSLLYYYIIIMFFSFFIGPDIYKCQAVSIALARTLKYTWRQFNICGAASGGDVAEKRKKVTRHHLNGPR